MAKTSKRKRIINKSNTVQNPPAQTLPQANLSKQQTVVTPYESYKYFKNDLKWSAITGGIVFIILIILYIFLR